MRRLMLLMGAVAIMGALVVGASGADSAEDPGCGSKWWPQPRQSSCANGSAPDVTAPSVEDVAGLELAWTFRAAAPVGNPVVHDGVVYVVSGSPRPRLHAFDLVSGRRRWNAISGPGSFQAPIADGDVLLHLSGGDVLRRYDLRTGRIFWRRYVMEVAWSAQQVIADGNWYFSTGAALVAFEERRGGQLWRRPLACWQCSVSAAAGRVYAAGTTDPYVDATGAAPAPGALYALDARSGATIWSAHGPADYKNASSPILAGGRVIVLSSESRGNGVERFFLEAYRASDGWRLWRGPVGAAAGFTSSSPAADPTLVVYPSANGYLYTLDARTGKQRWKVRIGETFSTPAIANGLVWIVDAASRLVAFAAEDGRTLWRSQPYPTQYDTWAPSPVVAGGFVLLGTYDDRLVAYHVPPR